MAENKEQSQKTEEPTQKRIDDAIREGHVAFSKEVNSFLSLLLATLAIFWLSGNISISTAKYLSLYISNFSMFFDADGDINILFLANKLIIGMITAGLLLFLFTATSAFIGSFMQNGIIFSPDAINPKLERISIFTGFKRIFSKRALVEFLKGLLKICILGFICYMVLKAELNLTIFSIYSEANFIFPIFHSLLCKALIAVCVFMAFFAMLDYLYTKFDYIQNLKMTREELKEELKQTEGNPQIKAKLKALRAAKSKRRMMAAIKEADVVITNPTHYSIALKYQRDKMPAPKVTAKGIDHMALQIRKLAKKHNVPLMENKPLAKALYDNVEVDEYIPFEHYKAVAAIISKLMKF